MTASTDATTEVAQPSWTLAPPWSLELELPEGAPPAPPVDWVPPVPPVASAPLTPVLPVRPPPPPPLPPGKKSGAPIAAEAGGAAAPAATAATADHDTVGEARTALSHVGGAPAAAGGERCGGADASEALAEAAAAGTGGAAACAGGRERGGDREAALAAVEPGRSAGRVGRGSGRRRDGVRAAATHVDLQRRTGRDVQGRVCVAAPGRRPCSDPRCLRPMPPTAPPWPPKAFTVTIITPAGTANDCAAPVNENVHVTVVVPVQAGVAPVLGAAAISPTAADAKDPALTIVQRSQPIPVLRTARQEASPLLRAVSQTAGQADLAER